MTPTPITDRASERLRGRVAIVTGASSGIGAATALRLARHGASVLVTARRADLLESLVGQITSAGGTATAAPGDAADPRAVTAMVERALSEFGRLDYAVNNAGVPARGGLLDAPMDLFDTAMNVNYRAVLLAMRAELPPLLETGGAIVNTSSVGGLVGVPGLSAYVASKHAVVGLTKSAALEFAERGVRINAVAPGGTDTGMLSSGTQAQRDFLAGLSAMKRLSDPDEVAAAIEFLLVDATSSTGVILPTDGGQTAA